MVAIAKSPLTVLLFQPGRVPCFLDTFEDLEAYYALLGCDTADATFFRVGLRMYAVWCDDDAVAKGLPENRRLTGDHKYGGWMMRGTFFVTRVKGDSDTGVDEADLRYIRSFVEF